MVCLCVRGFFGAVRLDRFPGLVGEFATVKLAGAVQQHGHRDSFSVLPELAFPAGDIEAVGFDYGEIAWARTVKEKRITPDAAHHNAGQTTYLTYVDLGLAKADLSELEAQLRAERQRKPVGFMVSMDYPVQVLPGGVVEVRWSGGIKPAARKAIEFLGRHVKIVAADSRMVDLTHQWNLSPADERGKIIALAKSGDEIGAVKLAQQIYGVSLTDATEMVDKMVEES